MTLNVHMCAVLRCPRWRDDNLTSGGCAESSRGGDYSDADGSRVRLARVAHRGGPQAEPGDQELAHPRPVRKMTLRAFLLHFEPKTNKNGVEKECLRLGSAWTKCAFASF